MVNKEEIIYLIMAMYQPEKRYEKLIVEGNKMIYPLQQGNLKGYILTTEQGEIDLNESLKLSELIPIELIKETADDIINKYKEQGLEYISIYLSNEQHGVKPIRVCIPL